MPFNRSACAQHLGKAGLYLFAVSGFIAQGGVYAGLALMLLGFLLVADRAWKPLRREPAFAVALALTLYILLNGAAAVAAWPAEPSARFLRSTWDLVAVGGLFSLLVGWWLAGDDRRIALVLQLALLGLFIGVLKGIDWRHLSANIATRPLFGMGNGAGLYALIAMTGLLVLRSSALFSDGWQQRRLPPALIRVCLLLLFLLFTAVLLLSQTRAVWLAALIVLPGVFVLTFRRNGGKLRQTWLAGFEVVVLVVLILGVTLGAGTIGHRLDEESSSLMLLFSGDLGALPESSISYRIWLWQEASQRIAGRPLFGWGAGSAALLIQESAVPGGLRHYHNLYLQLATELGLAGLGLFALWTLVTVKAAVRACRERRMAFELLLFLIAVLAIFLIVACFQIRHDDERGQYLLILFGALALTYRLGAARARSD